jgi:branched-chain amino acid transport system substrate-binding protein
MQGKDFHMSTTFRMTNVWRGAAAASVAVLAVGCAPSQEATGGGTEAETEIPDTVRIGATLPLTGSESRVGGFYKEGYELAFELANKDGGLDFGDKKAEVELVLLDDTSEQAQAVNLAERLITSENVDALLGTYSTALVEAQSVVPERNQIPYVNGGGAATSIYDKGFEYVFGTLAPVELLATTEMDWIEEQQEAGALPTPAKIALLWENTSHGEDFRKGITDVASDSGGDYEIVVDESFPFPNQDFSAVLNKVQAADADLFMVDAHLPDFITAHRQYITSGMCHPIVTYGARGPEPDAAKALGQENVAGILSAVWWNAQLGDEGLNKDFVDAFQTKYGRAPEWYQALGFATARALFTAMENAGSVDHKAVRDALDDLSVESILPGGQLEFGDNGQATYPFVVQQNMPDGTSPIIYPADVATGEGFVKSCG